MIDRRTLIALGLSTPMVGSSLRLDEPDPRTHPLDTGGVQVVGISPDASMLLGTRDDGTICILDADTLEVISENDAIPNIRLLDFPAVSWSPDGSRLAMNTRPWEVLQDSSIFVMDVASGEVTDLTPEENEDTEIRLMESDQANVDTNPMWLDDERLLFSRHAFAGTNMMTTLCILTLSDGAIETWVDLTSAGVLYVSSPIWNLSDGSVIFGTDSRKNDQNINSAMIVSPAGEIEEIELGDGGGIRVLSVNETHLIAFDHRMFSYLYLSLDSPEGGGDIWKHFNEPAPYRFRSDPTLGPVPDTVLLVAENDNEQTYLLQISETETTEIAQLSDSGGPFTINLAEDVILVSSDDSAWLILPED